MLMTGLSGNEIYCLAQKGFDPGNIVVGNSVQSLGLARGFTSGLKMMSGGEIRSITELIVDGRHAAINRLEADGTTNLSDALALARNHLLELDRRRYAVILTDGYPDSSEAAIEEARLARESGIDIVAIGIGSADLEYLRRIASTESGSIFAQHGELVTTFGRIARMIAEGGRGLRALT